jgi:hypothetical protein
LFVRANCPRQSRSPEGVIDYHQVPHSEPPFCCAAWCPRTVACGHRCTHKALRAEYLVEEFAPSCRTGVFTYERPPSRVGQGRAKAGPWPAVHATLISTSRRLLRRDPAFCYWCLRSALLGMGCELRDPLKRDSEDGGSISNRQSRFFYEQQCGLPLPLGKCCH